VLRISNIELKETMIMVQQKAVLPIFYQSSRLYLIGGISTQPHFMGVLWALGVNLGKCAADRNYSLGEVAEACVVMVLIVPRCGVLDDILSETFLPMG
jgi:hypothetical protein